MDRQILQDYVDKKNGMELQTACAELLNSHNDANIDVKKEYYTNCVRKVRHLIKKHPYNPAVGTDILERGIELDEIGADLL